MKLKVFLASIALTFIYAIPANANEVGTVPVMTDAAGISEIDLLGPGGRIHGADISRWQHPNGKLINFEKMHKAGVRYVMIKASDTRDEADALAYKYVKIDREAAQAAGIFTGFYHYAILPNVTSPSAIRKDATAQAQKVVWRIASIGGLNSRDLPYALDLENKCVKFRSNNSCIRYATNSAVTLWAETFLRTVKEKTGKTPILYSYSNFLEGSMKRSKELAQYPLWIAQYSIDPGISANKPGVKKAGCYVHSWTTSECNTDWVMWQYTSCGIAPKYGVPGNRLDLNVFGGSPTAFSQLLAGVWQPSQADVMPTDEPSRITVNNLTFSSTNKPLLVDVDVVRPNGAPVVTGSVKWVVDPATPISAKLKQEAERATSGSWTLSVKGIPAGSWNGKIMYEDKSGTHATSYAPISITIDQGATPTPKPTPKPTPTKKKTDGCRNQIKN